jgi:hypothetical protein
MKRILFILLIVFMVLSISIAISELLLRLTGHTPKISNEWPTVEPDPILGWKNREGVFTMPPYQIPHCLKLWFPWLWNLSIFAASRKETSAVKEPKTYTIRLLLASRNTKCFNT